MPKTAAARQTPATVLPMKVPIETKEEGLKMLQTLSPPVDALQVRTEEEYQEADTVLARIRHARKTWTGRMEKIIRPIRQGLDELYALNREVDKPLEALEESVKTKMKVFKVNELRQLKAAEDARLAEEDRLRREAEEKARAAERAATPQLKGRLQAQAARAELQADTVAQRELPTPVLAASSTTRPVRKVRITDLTHFIQGIVDGYVPEDCISDPRVMAMIQVKLNAYFKDDPEGMAAWPGVEVYDDVQIVGR